MDDILRQFNDMKNSYNEDIGSKKTIEKLIDSKKQQVESIEKEIKEKKEISLLLQQTATNARETVKSEIELAVTAAIKFISGKDYTFEIDITSLRGKASAEFYIVEDIDGEISRQKPEDSCGGGFVDIISSALRYIYSDLYNNPKIMSGFIFDEPGKMVDADSSIKFSEFLKDLGKSFNKQSILVTHNEQIANIGEHSIRVVKVDNKSIIEEI